VHILFAPQSGSFGLLSVVLAKRGLVVSSADPCGALTLFETFVLNGPSCHLRSRMTFNCLVLRAVSIIALAIFLFGVPVATARNVMASLHLQGLVHSDLLQLLGESLRHP